jgi:ribosomal 50S subunit-recycling heat shock protein
MSDTVVVDLTGVSGVSTTARVSTDQVVRNSVTEHQQIMKIALGEDGVHNRLLDAGQQSSVSSISVVLSNDHSNVPIAGSVTFLNTSVSVNTETSVTVNNAGFSVTVLNPVNSVTVNNESFEISGSVSVNTETSVTVNNEEFNTTVLNPTTSVTVNNAGFNVLNPTTSVTVNNTEFDVTVQNPVSSVTVNNTIFSVTVLNPDAATSSVTVLNPSLTVNTESSVTVNNEEFGVTGSVTVNNEEFNTTVLNPTTSVTVNNESFEISGSVSVNTETSVTVNNEEFNVTILNSTTSVTVLNNGFNQLNALPSGTNTIGSVTMLNVSLSVNTETSVTVNNADFGISGSVTVNNEEFSVTSSPGDGWFETVAEGDDLSAAEGVPVMGKDDNDEAFFLPGTTNSGLLVNLGSNNDITVSGSVSVNTETSVTINNESFEISGSVSVNNAGFNQLNAIPSGTNIIGSVTALGAATAANQSSLLIELYIMNGSMAMQTSVTGSDTYQGWAEPGTSITAASWRVRKITESSGDYSITWADGDRSFNNVWNNCTSLTYS